MNEAKSRHTVVKPSSPTQSPPHSGADSREITMAGAEVPLVAPSSEDQAVAISLETASSKPSSSSSSSAKAEGAIAVAALMSTSSSSTAKTSDPLSLSSSSKSLTASGWTVLSSESSSERGTSTSKSVSSKMSFSPFLTTGGGVADSDGLAFDGAALAAGFAGLAGASDLCA